MDLGDHFHGLAQRLAAAGFEPEDAMAILNNYALGVQRRLDARECPRCFERLMRRTDRLLSTPHEEVHRFTCDACKLVLVRSEPRPLPVWTSLWKRFF